MNKKIFILICLLFMCKNSYSAITDGSTCDGGNQNTDGITVECTVAACDNQIMIITVFREENQDKTIDVLTWNGASALGNFIGSAEGWSTQVDAYQYYLLAPDTGTHDLVLEWTNAVTVDTILGMTTICGAKQQANEAVATADNNYTVDITTITANAFIVSNVGDISMTNYAIAGDLDTKIFENDNGGADTQAVGTGATTSSGSYTCGWTPDDTTASHHATVCSAWEEAGAAAPTTIPGVIYVN